MNDFAIHIIILSVSIYFVGRLTKLFYVEDFFTAVVSALILAIVNAVIRPILIFLTFPLTILTLGFFLLLINGFSLIIVSRIVPKFKIGGCLTAALAAILISFTSLILDWLIH